MNINLHINELVLEGLPLHATHSAEVKAAVETELVSMLTSGGLMPSQRGASARPAILTDNIHLGEGSTAASLGRQIAQVVYRGVSR